MTLTGEVGGDEGTVQVNEDEGRVRFEEFCQGEGERSTVHRRCVDSLEKVQKTRNNLLEVVLKRNDGRYGSAYFLLQLPQRQATHGRLFCASWRSNNQPGPSFGPLDPISRLLRRSRPRSEHGLKETSQAMRSEQSTREKLRDGLRSRRGSSEEWCQDRHSLGGVVAVRKEAVKKMLVGQSNLETRAKKWETNESSSLSTNFLSATSYSSFLFHPSETAILRTGLMTPTSLTSLVTSVNGCWVAKSSSARTAVVSSRLEGRGGVRG